MGNFVKKLAFLPGTLHAFSEDIKKTKEITDRLTISAKKYREDGEHFKIIARPYKRRAILDKTFNLGISITMEIEVRAIDENGGSLEVTRIWTTKNGKNKDIRRPSKGKGRAGDLGPYIVPYKPSSSGFSKFKVETAGDKPSIIYYKVRQGNMPAGTKLPKEK